MRSIEKREYELKLTDQVHIHLPENAFRREATNGWLLMLLGGFATIAILSCMAKK